MPTKNVFVSHYGEDDEHIGNLKTLLGTAGYALKNSSIDSTKPNKASNDEYIKGLLRDGIRWAGTVIVLIGRQTHTREWVDYEIEQAAKQGKRIVGIYIHGENGAIVPESFEECGNALVGWNTEKIIKAIEGKDNWENQDGSEHRSKWVLPRGEC
jgi:hypothetical protein